MIVEIEKPSYLNYYTFYPVSDDCILYVPAGTRDAYIAAGGWEEVFQNRIVEMDGTETSINELSSEIQHTDGTDIYSMDGKKLGKLTDTSTFPTGLYIIAGKKVLINPNQRRR